MDSNDFFMNQTLDNRAVVNTYTIGAMLFQFYVTTATFIELNKSA